MKEEVARILKMVQEGKIDSDKAAELLEALNALPVFEQMKKEESGAGSDSGIGERVLKIRVVSGDKEKVNVNLPLKFVKNVLNAFGKIPISHDGMDKIDMKMIADAIESGMVGKIVDVQSPNGDLIEVIIE